MPISSVSPGVKRSRDDNNGLTAPQTLSSHATIIEITHGMTQRAAQDYERRCGDLAAVYQDMDALISSPSFRKKTWCFFAPRGDGSITPDGPVEMGVVQLVANDGKTLLFTSDAIPPVNVSDVVGQRFCIGDLILFQRCLCEDEEENGGVSSASAMVEFVAMDPSVLADAADWCHAASWSVVAMAKWMHQLLSCPPGLGQLTCIMDSFWGAGGESASVTDAWLRSLQLPVLLRQLKRVEGVEERKIHQLKKVVFSLLRLYVAILGNAETIITLSCTVDELVYQFLGSLLFVDGLSVVLPQLAGNVSESTWLSAQQTMMDAMKFSMRYICRDVVEEEGKGRREARENAERGFLTILHRISALGMKQEAKGSEIGMHAVMKLVDEMARIGIFRRVTQWMRQQERLEETVSLLEKIHRPPTLEDVKDLHGLNETSLKEALTAMMQTYTPYLRQETLRFVESAMMAAYAELYGPVARDVSKYMETVTTMATTKVGGNVAQQNQGRPLHVTRVSQPAFRPNISEYSLEEVRMTAMFGLPLTITLRVTDEMDTPCNRHILGSSLSASSFGCILVLLNGKPFIFPLILCGAVGNKEEGKGEGEGVNVITATVYVLRDRDILPSLVEASASTSAAYQSIPNAFFFSDVRRVDKGDGDTNDNTEYEDGENDSIHCYYHFSNPTPRFMPLGTSAVSYLLYIHHLQRLRTQMRQEEWSNVAAVGRIKGGQGVSDGATSKTVLWWGGSKNKSTTSNTDTNDTNSSSGNNNNNNSNNNSNGMKGDFFVHSGTLAGENEVLQQQCLSDVTESTSLTPAQVECLRTLMTAGPGVRTLVGAVGCGKTTLMHASSVSRGRMQEALRKRHQPLWHAAIKHSGKTLSMCVGELAGAEGMEDLFKASGDVSSSARDILEEVTNAALGHIQEHVNLSEKLRQCHSPMLLRPNRLKQTIPPQVTKVLQNNNFAQNFCSIETLMTQSHQRSLNAPLVGILNARLQSLKRLGDRTDTIIRMLEEDNADEEGNWRLFVELLPWIMSKKERQDTFAEAMRRDKRWASYLSEELWDVSTIVRSNDFDERRSRNENVWKTIGPASRSFHAVTLPNTSRSLCEYTPAEAAGWRAVFWEKQRDLLSFLHQEIMDEGRQIFLFLLDLIQAVGATSQTSKVTVVTATGKTLLRELPFLRTWQPRYLIVDDYDQISNSLYLTLSSVNSAIISHQVEPPLQHEQHVSLVILRSLQKELQGTPFLSTVVLSESLRFSSPDLHKAVQLCRNSSMAFYAPLQLGDVSTNNNNNNNNNNSNNGGGQDMNLQGPFTGFSSPCCVEFWTHAVSLSDSVSCDGLAAAFVRNHFKEIDPSMTVTVYCGFMRDKTVILEGTSSGSVAFTSDNISVTNKESVSVVPMQSDAFVERDEECDVAVLCLSGIARRLRRVSATERQHEWDRLGAEQSFVEHLEWWLWRTMSYASRGAILVGSREVFSFLEPLQRLERFVLQVREQQQFWLPLETRGSVLALRCPEHEKCRQLAVMTHSDYRGCQVRVIGQQTCQSLCLAPYDNCTNSSHACLHTCHVLCKKGTGGLAAGDEEAPSHSNCPFPCARAQLCGHICARRCGEPCFPCEFVGLRELSCGQRVVSGMSDAGPVQTLVHHFQRIRCGESPRPCEERVTLRCLRCGFKNPMLCHEVTVRGGMELAALTELECAGCVALYNDVAKEFGVEGIVRAVPPAVGGEFPVKNLPEAAQEKLQKLRSFKVKKAQLMLQKEALEMMQGKQTCEYYQQQGIYSRMQKQQEEELQAHQQRVQESIQSWAKTLKQKYEAQMAVNEVMDTELPLMVSEAMAEEEKQRSHLFV